MLTRILENTFNHLLASDYQGKQRLATHNGKSVGFKIKPVRQVFNQITGYEIIATITNEGLSLHDGSAQQADCSISGTPIALIQYMNASHINPSTNSRLGIEIDGDLEFAREISSVFRGLDIDWEAIISQLIGDAPAFQLTKFISNFRQDIVSSKNSAKAHLHYIITDRLDQVVSVQEAEQFYSDVDQIAVDAIKLEQKINLLTESLNHG